MKSPVLTGICTTLLGAVCALTLQAAPSASSEERPSDDSRYPLCGYVDPRIGSEGLGRVFIGPSCPFGMVKPSPDCTPSPNSGWLPMPERVDGFAQIHVSGTGGGPKYGNILVMPFVEGMDRTSHIDYRLYEHISLGYYDTRFRESGIRSEVTTASRASMYRFTYPAESARALAIDAGFFLGESPVPDAREAQQFVGSEIQILSDHEVCGYSRIRGGWNNGKAYTVYFHAETDRPFVRTATWRGTAIQPEVKMQADGGTKCGALLRFADTADADSVVQLKIGISFISCLKARQNLQEELPHWSFQQAHDQLLISWENLLERIELSPRATDAQKRMFYTALYHTMLMPVDRTGENPLWNDPGVPYYDDFYAIWDTYRSSSPLITLIDPEREADIVRSLVNICRRDGYMPDARSGNCNGRTQGGSNAEIVIADAFVKGVKGVDYEQALEAMLKDATVDPGANHEAEGRGGLNEYLRLGYVPYGIPRAGNRTVEYAYCDYAIALVAKGLGKEALYQHYLKQSGNWKNLWRSDYQHEGAQGFILPRDAQGNWLDELPFGHSELEQPTFRYTPLTFEGPWYKPWWSMFFYEASSWEYSLSIPHDVPGLMEACGGREAFERRLDIFFDRGFFNVNNEPSFLSPCLYHWLDKPWRSSDRILDIIRRHYNDTPKGLPGNDDSGAMSSWLAFHFTGLYPNAGQDYYLIHTPVVDEATYHPAPGVSFRIVAKGLSEKNRYIQSITLNGKPYPCSILHHADLVAGGELVLQMGRKPVAFSMEGGDVSAAAAQTTLPRVLPATGLGASLPVGTTAARTAPSDSTLLFVFRLHGQTRRYQMSFHPCPHGELRVEWGIERNLHWQSGSFTLPAEAVQQGSRLNFTQPEDGKHLGLQADETSYLLSARAYRELTEKQRFTYNGRTFRLVERGADSKGRPTLRVREDAEGCEMWIWDRSDLPLVLQMQNNPLEIEWRVE